VALVALGALPLDAYRRGAAPLVWALRPAVVALGWLLYRQRAELRRWALPLAGGVVAGSAVSLVVTPLLARWLDAPPLLQTALALKSVTSAVAVDLAARVGADAALTVPFVIVTGILGAAFGPPLLRRVLPGSPPARGLAVGTNSHGIGTAAVAEREEGELPAALAGLAMAGSAVATGLLAPFAFALLGLP
jgi:putative effector of murein hydrolase